MLPKTTAGVGLGTVARVRHPAVLAPALAAHRWDVHCTLGSVRAVGMRPRLSYDRSRGQAALPKSRSSREVDGQVGTLDIQDNSTKQRERR